jgi:hypothetical protein
VPYRVVARINGLQQTAEQVSEESGSQLFQSVDDRGVAAIPIGSASRASRVVGTRTAMKSGPDSVRRHAVT